MDIGRLIEEALERMGYTQAQLARELGRDTADCKQLDQRQDLSF